MLFEFRKVNKNYGVHRIFRNLSLSLERNTFSILTGPSGSGKTTLFKMLCGIERPNTGEIYFLDRPLHQHSATHLKQIGLIFQNPRGLPHLSVFENIEMPLVIDGIPKEERAKRVTHWLEVLGLRQRANSAYSELSGGEVQKAEFARAMIRRPRLILADEPTAHLDSIQSDLLMDILWEHYQEGATVFISTHHPPVFEHPQIQRYHLGQYGVKLLNPQAGSADVLVASSDKRGEEEVHVEIPS